MESKKFTHAHCKLRKKTNRYLAIYHVSLPTTRLCVPSNYETSTSPKSGFFWTPFASDFNC